MGPAPAPQHGGGSPRARDDELVSSFWQCSALSDSSDHQDGGSEFSPECEENPLFLSLKALGPLNKDILPYFTPSERIEDRIGSTTAPKTKRPRVNSDEEDTAKAGSPTKKAKYRYDTEKPPRSREVPLPSEEFWSFALLQRQRRSFVGGAVLPTLAVLPVNYSSLPEPTIVARDPGVVHLLSSPAAHADYTLPEKPDLDEGSKAQLVKAMGPLNYAIEPFPHRLLNRKEEFDRLIGIPQAGRWHSYFDEGDPGLKLDFRDEGAIPPLEFINRPFAGPAADCVYETIEKLEAMGIARECRAGTRPYRSNPIFTLETGGPDRRLIVDVSSLAEFIVGKRFRYEDLNAWLLSLVRGSYSFHIDLVKAYYLIEIAERHQKYLGFNYITRDGTTRHMIMTAMVMGLNPACETFTSLDRLFITRFRTSMGVNLYPYLDDTSGNDRSRSRANSCAREIALQKARCGQVISLPKSSLEAAQVLPMLGLVVRTVPEVSIEIHPKRVEKILGKIKALLDRLEGPILKEDGSTSWTLLATPREIASIGGSSMAGSRVTGKGTAMHLRHLYTEAAYGFIDFDQERNISHAAINELMLLESFHDLRRPAIRRLVEGVRFPPIDLKHISDSSATGYGLFISRYLHYSSAAALIRGPEKQESEQLRDRLLALALSVADEFTGGADEVLRPLLSAETFTSLDSEASSLVRELIPILATCIIAAKSGCLRNRTIVFYSDNAGVPRVFLRGSGVPQVHALAAAISNLLLRENCVGSALWVPRETPIMVTADTSSRITDSHDYIFSQQGFDAFFADARYRWERPTVDLFASRRNSKCPDFFSQTYSDGCMGISATEAAWPQDGSLLYAFPPIRSLAVVLSRALHTECAIYILLPIWPSSPFHTLFCPDGSHFREEILAWRYIDRTQLLKGLAPPPFFAYDASNAVVGHANMFVMVYLDSRRNRKSLIPRSHYNRSFCLRAHYTGDASCTSCNRPDLPLGLTH